MRATGTSAGMCYFLLVWMDRDALDGYSRSGTFCWGVVFRPHLDWVGDQLRVW